MSNALSTGVTGLIAHQRMLDVVGHNIANLNTNGFKKQHVLFADLFYENLAAASGATATRGGTNGSQIGQGVTISQIDRDFTPGTLEATGGQYDLAIAGDGFFVLNDGGSELYTRAGAFHLDAGGVLIGPGGLQVQRLSGVGEPDGINGGFQVPGNLQIRIPNDATIPGVPTSEVTVTGHLSTTTTPPLATVKSSTSPFETKGGQTAVLTTLLNDLEGNQTPYAGTDTIVIDGRNADGSNIAPISLPAPSTTTLGDLVNAINGISGTGFTASLNGGRLVLTADETGPSDKFAINFRDESGNTGNTDFTLQKPEVVTTVGADEGVERSSVGIVDPRGTEHELQLTFSRTDDDAWRLNVAMDPSEGVVVQDVVEPIEFNDDGTFRTTGDPTIVLEIEGFDAPQVVRFSFSSDSTLQSLNNQGSEPTGLSVFQDGFKPGTLRAENVKIDADGSVVGIVNGRDVLIAQLAVVSFQNPKGLVAIGDNLFTQSLNSGDPELGAAGTGSRGQIRGGQLESSNVDIAFEFTRLIVAQRGFSANARTITVSDEVLEELTNIIR